MRVILMLALLFGSSAVVKAEDVPDYWPLEVGNQWVYLRIYDDGFGRHEENVILEVTAQVEIDEEQYFELSNGQLLRKDHNGNIVERNQSESIDETIYDFTNLDDPSYLFEFPYSVFPPAREGKAITGYPASRFTSENTGRLLTLALPAGTFEVIHFGFGDLSWSTNIFFAEDVGVVKSGSGGHMGTVFDSYLLVKYRVSGITYPTAIGIATWADLKLGSIHIGAKP